MKIIDLTHTLYEGMPIFPGTPVFRMVSYEEAGYRETLLGFTSHTGTHMDAPAHLFVEGKTLNAFEMERFIGKGLIIDCTHLKPGEQIPLGLVENNPLAEQADFLIFYTGWDIYWGEEKYFGKYPCVSPEIVQYLIEKGKKGIGLDTIGIDPICSKGLPLHKQLLSKGTMVIIENLTNLGQVGNELFTFCAFPLKFQNADGAPVRAAAILEPFC